MSALPVASCPPEAELEFDRQIDALVATGLPDALDLAEECFRASVEPLRDLLPPVPGDGDRLPFVVVVPGMPVVPVLETVHTVGGAGFTTMTGDDLAGFRPLPELGVPAGPYLLLDVDAGQTPSTFRPRACCRASQPPAAARSPSSRGWPCSCPTRGSCGAATASPWPARGRGTSGFRPSGSALDARGWAGATRALRTPGWARPPVPVAGASDTPAEPSRPRCGGACPHVSE